MLRQMIHMFSLKLALLPKNRQNFLEASSSFPAQRSVYYYLDLDIRANFEFLVSSKEKVEVSQTN